MRRHSQRGAAILIAMIIVTLISTMAATMVWQQWRSVQVEASERVRAQATWILAGALDYARLILREDSNSNNKVDHLGEPWAVPLAESRLSTFLAGDNAGDGSDAPEAFLSGTIVDANAKYNLRNLIGTDNSKPDPANMEIFLRLADSAGVSAAVAQQIAQSLLAAATASGVVAAASAPANPTAPLMPQSIDQLRWFGIDAQTIKLLEPLVTILPATSLVNVNTASKEVIAGVVQNMDLGTAQRIVTQRQSKPFENTSQLSLPPQLKVDGLLGTTTNFFEVTGRLRLGDKVLEERSLVARQPPNNIVPMQRRRVSSIDYAG